MPPGTFNEEYKQPVQVSDEIEAIIEAVGEKGDGLFRRDGFVVFVPNVQEGQKVMVKVTKVLRKVGFGEVVEGASAPAEEVVPVVAEENDESEAEDVPLPEPSESFGDDEDLDDDDKIKSV